MANLPQQSRLIKCMNKEMQHSACGGEPPPGTAKGQSYRTLGPSPLQHSGAQEPPVFLSWVDLCRALCHMPRKSRAQTWGVLEANESRASQ